MEHEDGSRAAELLFDSCEICQGKYMLSGLPAVWADKGEAETLKILLKDKASGVEVTLLYGVFEEYDVITRACRIRNGGETEVWLERALSACLDIQRDDLEMITFLWPSYNGTSDRAGEMPSWKDRGRQSAGLLQPSAKSLCHSL